MLRFALLIGVCALLSGAAHSRPITRDQWIKPEKAVSPVRLEDGSCLDLRALPEGWRVLAGSTATEAIFGLPGEVDLKIWPRFKIMVGIGDDEGAIYRYRDYAQGWAEPGQPKPSPNDPALDVDGFEGYPADDGETVFVSEALDALMECSPDLGCTIHDGVQPRPGRLFVVIAYEPAKAALVLKDVRRTVRAIRTACPGS